MPLWSRGSNKHRNKRRLALGARLRLAMALGAPLVVNLVFSCCRGWACHEHDDEHDRRCLFPGASSRCSARHPTGVHLWPDGWIAPGPVGHDGDALLVPVTFYLSPIAAIATVIAASAMAIFSGDIPGTLLRIPARRRRQPIRTKPTP